MGLSTSSIQMAVSFNPSLAHPAIQSWEDSLVTHPLRVQHKLINQVFSNAAGGIQQIRTIN